jgi:hypothetical protein
VRPAGADLLRDCRDGDAFFVSELADKLVVEAVFGAEPWHGVAPKKNGRPVLGGGRSPLRVILVILPHELTR